MYSVYDLLPVLNDVIQAIATQARADADKPVDFVYYPSPPESSTYPFAQLGSIKEMPEDTDLIRANEIMFSIEFVSRPNESRAAIDLGSYGECIWGCEWIRDGIHRQEQAFKNAGLANIIDAVWLETNYLQETDTLTYRGVMVYKVLIDS